MRHCEAQGNLLRVFQGHWNGKITQNGALQLSYLSEKMKEYPFDILYSSPLSRAVSTAKACNVHYNKPIHINNDLIEINGGLWEGKKFASFPIDFPDENTLWSLEPHKFVAPQGESIKEVFDRMTNAVKSIAAKYPGKTICICSHGCAIRTFICFAKGWDLTKLNDVEWCDNTGISVIDFDEQLQPHLIVENDSAHIPADLSTLSKQNWWRKENRGKIFTED